MVRSLQILPLHGSLFRKYKKVNTVNVAFQGSKTCIFKVETARPLSNLVLIGRKGDLREKRKVLMETHKPTPSVVMGDVTRKRGSNFHSSSEVKTSGER